MEWDDIEVAAASVNEAYTVNQLLGHVIIRLESDAEVTLFPSHQDAHDCCKLARRAMGVADALLTKHRRRCREDDIAVIKSLEVVLAKVKTLFVQGGLNGYPSDVLDEERFNRAAETVCNSLGETGLSPPTGLKWDTQPDAAWAIIKQDEPRLSQLIMLGAAQWMSQAATARVVRAPWVDSVEIWCGLRSAVDNELAPSGDALLPMTPRELA